MDAPGRRREARARALGHRRGHLRLPRGRDRPPVRREGRERLRDRALGGRRAALRQGAIPSRPHRGRDTGGPGRRVRRGPHGETRGRPSRLPRGPRRQLRRPGGRLLLPLRRRGLRGPQGPRGDARRSRCRAQQLTGSPERHPRAQARPRPRHVRQRPARREAERGARDPVESGPRDGAAEGPDGLLRHLRLRVGRA